MFQMNTNGSGIVSNNWRAKHMSPNSREQQKESILFCIMGLHIMPVLIVREWICLRWFMDLQVSRRESEGFSVTGDD